MHFQSVTAFTICTDYTALSYVIDIYKKSFNVPITPTKLAQVNPMTTSTDQAKPVAELLIKAGTPDNDSSTRVVVYSGGSLGTGSEMFTALLEQLTAAATKSRRASDIALRRKCISHVLNSLIHAMFRFEWLSLPTNPANFKNGQYLANLGFDQRRMQRIVEVLLQHDVMRLGRLGFIDHREGMPSKASQYFPTESFINNYANSLYTGFGDFDNYQALKFENFDEVDMPSQSEMDRQESIIRRYNEYMRHHTWAMKNPSSRSFKDFVGRSGRINNCFQTLANRRLPLRINTMIDGEAIAEPDFSCNHLRMASFLLGEELPADPYSVIASDTGLTRDVIKTVITKCIGAFILKQKGGIFLKAPNPKHGRVAVNATEFKAALASIESHYPWVAKQELLFNDVGTRMQYLEGEIALEMLEWAVEEDVPLVAVHDAYACKCADADKVYKQMLDVWSKVLDSAKTANYLSATQYTVTKALQRKEAEAAMKKALEA